MSVTGSVRFNDSDLKRVSNAYVLQQDILLPTLTPRETIEFAYDLTHGRRDKSHSSLVEQCILLLGLKDCANTRIGDENRRGCSGGEKRRTSIGVQLMREPDVLFLDEPTTGLDAFVAAQVVAVVKALNRTVWKFRVLFMSNKIVCHDNPPAPE